MGEFKIDNNFLRAENLKEKRVLELKEFGKKYLSDEEFKKLEDGLNSFAGEEPGEDFLKSWEEKANSALAIKAEEAEEYARLHGTGEQASQWEEGRDS